MIFAAGHGTRLHPYTATKPKALVEINGVTLLELAIRKLIFHGFNQIVINVHSFGDQIIEFVKNHPFEAQIFISDEREQLLDTGGGLIKALPFFDDGMPFLVYNVDIVTTTDLRKFYAQHLVSRPLASLLVRKRETSRYLLFNEEMSLCGWENRSTGEKIWVDETMVDYESYAFSGIHIVEPRIIKYAQSEETCFPLIPFYLKSAKSEPIIGVEDADSVWFDVGKIPQLTEVAEYLKNEKYPD